MFDAFLETFRDSGYAAFTALALSAIAIVLSLISLLSSRRSNRRLIQIEEARDNAAQTASDSAVLRGHLVRAPSANGRSTNTALIIDNTGDGTARDIVMLLDAVPAAKHGAFMSGNDFDLLGPQSSKRCSLAITSHSPTPTRIEISWTDDTGERKTYESTL